MSKEYTVVFYERSRKKGQKPGSQLVPYYGPKGNALTRYVQDDDNGQGRAAGDMARQRADCSVPNLQHQGRSGEGCQRPSGHGLPQRRSLYQGWGVRPG
jgi:hypothetical protein